LVRFTVSVIWSGYSADQIVAAFTSRYRYYPRQLCAIGESVMLRRFIIAIAIVAACDISFSSTNASAAILGGGGGHSHSFNLYFFNKHSPRYGHRAYGQYGGYGYFPYGGFVEANLPDYTPDYSNYYIDPISAFATLHLLDPVIPPPRSLSCKHSQEIKTVPSEDGGERKITITRC
jgi:hypothetical protein